MMSVSIDDHQSMMKMNPRRTASLNREPVARTMNLYSSMSSLNHLMMISMDPNKAINGLYDHHFHAPFMMRPLYSSLPQASNYAPQPPLLPLPTNKKNSSITNTHNYKNGATRKKISKPFISSKKSIPRDNITDMKEIPKLVKKTSTSSEDEKIYTLSPPPSSLPLPSLALIRHRVASASVSCTAEAAGGAKW